MITCDGTTCLSKVLTRNTWIEEPRDLVVAKYSETLGPRRSVHLDVRLMKVFASGEVGGRIVHGEMKCHFLTLDLMLQWSIPFGWSGSS